MTNQMQRRVGKIETALRPELPLHLPVANWTDDQLMRAIMPGGGTMTDAELQAVADGADVEAVLAARFVPFPAADGGRACQ